MISKRPANHSAANVLVALGKLGGEANCIAISKISGVERSTISHALGGLVKHGYVEREGRRITLTGVGLVAVALIHEARGSAAD